MDILAAVGLPTLPGESLFAVIGALLFSLSYSSQIVRIWRRKRAEDISWWFLGIISGALLMYVFYGYFHEDYVLMVSYSIIFILVSVIAALKYRYHILRFPEGDEDDREKGAVG